MGPTCHTPLPLFLPLLSPLSLTGQRAGWGGGRRAGREGGLEETRCRHLRAVVSAVEGAAGRRMHTAEAKLGRNAELDETPSLSGVGIGCATTNSGKDGCVVDGCSSGCSGSNRTDDAQRPPLSSRDRDQCSLLSPPLASTPYPPPVAASAAGLNSSPATRSHLCPRLPRLLARPPPAARSPQPPARSLAAAFVHREREGGREGEKKKH